MISLQKGAVPPFVNGTEGGAKMPEKAINHVPEGMHTITAHLWFEGNCKEAVEFYKKALGAIEIFPPMEMPGGKSVLHAMLKLGDSFIMMADAWPGTWEQGPKDRATTGLWVYVEDCDSVFKQAFEAGCEVLMPIEDAFWGDRFGKVKDPFGHCWAIATHNWEMTPDEMEEGQKEWLKNMGQ